MSNSSTELCAQLKAAADHLALVRTEVGKVIVGQRELVHRLLVCLVARGHVLLEGLPGLAKTASVSSLAQATHCRFQRIQFTPDLLPGDITGSLIYDPVKGTYSTRQGPIFANLVLADEINRAPSKVQSALLEAMQERQVTIGGQTHPLPKPFFVMATQNPVEQEGTYPLPEAQTDRFLFKLIVDYPTAEEESTMMLRWGQVTKQPALVPASSGEELLALRTEVDRIHVSPAIQNYVLALVRATRALTEGSPAQRLLTFGASPRASLALYQATRALAWLRGLEFVSPALVQEIAPDVLRHRIGLTYEAEAKEITADKIVAQVIAKTPVPAA